MEETLSTKATMNTKITAQEPMSENIKKTLIRTTAGIAAIVAAAQIEFTQYSTAQYDHESHLAQGQEKNLVFVQGYTTMFGFREHTRLQINATTHSCEFNIPKRVWIDEQAVYKTKIYLNGQEMPFNEQAIKECQALVVAAGYEPYTKECPEGNTNPLCKDWK